MFARRALTFLLVLTLAFPAWAAPTIVGNVASSESARVRGMAFTPGSTLFSGDTIEVGPKGIARLALTSGAQVQMAGKQPNPAHKGVRYNSSDHRSRLHCIPGHRKV